MSGEYVYSDWDRPEVAALLPPCRRLLDVGCAYGGFGHRVKAARPDTEVWGIEPEEAAATQAAARLDRVVVGRFPDDMPEGERFDCVVFNDSLEHLVDPWAAVRRARELLLPQGYVVASIPNVRFAPVVVELALRGRWDYHDSGVLDRTHLRFFTKSTMTEMFVTSGLDVLHLTPIRALDRGRIRTVLRLAGRRADEFLARQFVVVAQKREEPT